MSNPLPPEVAEHILSVMAEKEPVLPPKNAFTAQQYYDMLIKNLKQSGVKEEDYPPFDSVRRKLREDKTLNKTRYPYSGPFYYWQDNREINPVVKED